MIHDIVEFIRSMEEVLPLGSHPACWATWMAQVKDRWKQTFHDTADTALDPIQREEADWIFHGILEYRQVLHDAAWDNICGAAASPMNKKQKADTTWKELFHQPQIPQRTAEWYAEAKTILTASEFSKLFETPRVWSALVLSKCPATATTETKAPSRLACSRAEMNALDWGTCLETVVKQVLARKKGWDIRDLGRIRHRGGLPIAASPDGILVNDGPHAGNLIEIKCPLSRILDRSTIPFEYWCQMQIQMEVTDRPACEYVEMKFTLEAVAEEAAAAESLLAENELALVQDRTTLECFYVYEGDPRGAGGAIVLERMKWSVEDMRHTQVPRDRAWFASIHPTLTQFWIDVEAARSGTWKPPPPLEKKKPKPVFCSIVDSPPEPSSPLPLDVGSASQNDTNASTQPIASSR